MISCCYLIESKKWKIDDRDTGEAPGTFSGWSGQEESYGFTSGWSETEMQMYFDAMKKSQISSRLTKINEMTKELNQLNRLKLQDVYKAIRKAKNDPR